MKKFCVVIDGLGTATAIGAIKGLCAQEEYGVHIIGLDCDPLCAGAAFVDEFFTCPAARDTDFESFCLELVQTKSIDLWIPIIDYAFEKYAMLRPTFADKGCALMIGEPDSVSVCISKWRTFKLFDSLGIETPRSYLPEQFKRSDSAPFITKPNVGGRSSIDVEEHQSAAEVKSFLETMPPQRVANTLIQEKLSGIEFTVDCLANLNGELVNTFARRRLETKGGLSVKAEAISQKWQSPIFSVVKKISEALSLPGVFNVQGFITSDGKLLMFEVNPRFAGGHPFTIASGLNSAACLLKMLDDSFDPATVSLRYDLKMARYWSETFWDASGGDVEAASPHRRPPQ